jgi:predicted DNA binding CopG/RHH family protein
MKKTNKKRIPKFKNEDKEREFWATHSALDYFDKRNAKRVIMSNLKPSVKTISIRLPEIMLQELRLLAHKREVPYQSLLKMFLAERIELELEHSTKS